MGKMDRTLGKYEEIQRQLKWGVSVSTLDRVYVYVTQSHYYLTVVSVCHYLQLCTQYSQYVCHQESLCAHYSVHVTGSHCVHTIVSVHITRSHCVLTIMHLLIFHVSIQSIKTTIKQQTCIDFIKYSPWWENEKFSWGPWYTLVIIFWLQENHPITWAVSLTTCFWRNPLFTWKQAMINSIWAFARPSL